MRILITGGPGAGSTSTAQELGRRLQIPCVDSDRFFHKPTDPPFQEQYSPAERRAMILERLSAEEAWILSGSISTWGLEEIRFTHGVMMDVGREVRTRRLLAREQTKYGDRIFEGGDMRAEHESFVSWASRYEQRQGEFRSRRTDRSFARSHCAKLLVIDENLPFLEVVSTLEKFLSDGSSGKNPS